MIARAFFRLLPFMCLLMASAKHTENDTPSRRLSSPRQLRGMNDFDIEESVSPPIVDNGWNDPVESGNHHELRFLKKKKTKTDKTDSDKESTSTGKKGKKSKTKKKKKSNEVPIPDDDGIFG